MRNNATEDIRECGEIPRPRRIELIELPNDAANRISVARDRWPALTDLKPLEHGHGWKEVDVISFEIDVPKRDASALKAPGHQGRANPYK